MYSNILVPVFLEDEERVKIAVSAARLLLSPQGKIVLFNVVEEIPSYVETYVPEVTVQGNVDKAAADLKAAAAALGDDVDAKVVSGHAGRTILEQAEEMQSDCIVISSHRPGLADYFLGSTAGRVVRHASCPVLVLR